MPTVAKAIPAHAHNPNPETGNDRFKKSFSSRFWSSMIAATVLHFMLFQFWPTLTAADVSFTAGVIDIFELPPEIEIPPPPEAIAQPLTPVVGPADIDDDITITRTTFEDNPVTVLLPPPTSDGGADLEANPRFTPTTVRPEIKNRPEVEAALTREYPSILRDAGIGGQVIVWFFISEDGRVLDRRVSQSSGHADLDEAALRVADVFEFSPALNRDQVVRVWIQLPIRFQVQ